MLWAIIVILILLWLLGFFGSVAGDFIHILLALILIVFLLQVFVYGPRRGGPWSW
jgi:hypothetical protein